MFNVFFSDKQNTKSPNIHGSKILPYDIYLRNSFVSLYSVSKNNNMCECIIVTNNPLRDDYLKLFNDYGIQNIIIPFDQFQVPDTFKWSYAFYKICVLWHLVKEYDYDSYLELDTDTVVTQNLDVMWNDVENTGRLLLYNLCRKFDHPVANMISHDYCKINGLENVFIDQWGGEYVCGTRSVLEYFVDEIQKIYNQHKEKNFLMLNSESGDEAFISMAAANMRNHEIGLGNPYINRFWTGRFYLVSTVWKFDAVLIWHLPAEKKYGMLKIYDWIIRNPGKWPTTNKLAKMCSFPKAQPAISTTLLKKIWMNIKGK